MALSRPITQNHRLHNHLLIDTATIMPGILAAVAQMTSTPSITQNTTTVVGLIERAAAAGAKILFLPEATDL